MIRSAVQIRRISSLARSISMEQSLCPNVYRMPFSIRPQHIVCTCFTRCFISYLFEQSHPYRHAKSFCSPRRSVFSGAPKDSRTKPTELNDNEYHEKADQTLESLTSFFEDIGDNFKDNLDYDVTYSSGVLTVNLLPGYNFVMNKQSPNRQIWLSSPLSGPKRYDWLNGTWTYYHDGSTLHGLLSSEISELLKKSVDFTHCDFGKSISS